jgi:Peptidase MA superfamily
LIYRKMDILHKLKIIFWICVLSIAGSFMYQFLNKDKREETYQQIDFQKTFTTSTETSQPLDSAQILSRATTVSTTSEREIIKPIISDDILPSTTLDEAHPKDISERHTEKEKETAAKTVEVQNKDLWPAPPNGYAVGETRSLKIYREAPPISKSLTNTLNDLHGNLMFDLIAFSPWKRDRKVLLYLFLSPKTYFDFTGRPAWSGGTSSLSKRIIFVPETQETIGIIAHELSHIYFDSFFDMAKPSPLWLSEGMAVYVQTERGHSPPNWLLENLAKIKMGAGFDLRDLTEIESLHGFSDVQVKLWYAQSYSLVKFLMNIRSSDNFYRFCKYIKEGRSVSGSLYRAYGKPYDTLENLQKIWRYDVKTGKITGT